MKYFRISYADMRHRSISTRLINGWIDGIIQ